MLLLLLLLPLSPQLGAGWSPKNQDYEVQLQNQVTVQEGLCALVPCSFSSHKAGRNNSKITYFTWYRKNESHQNGQDYVLVATSSPAKKAQIKVKSSFHPIGDPRAHNCTLRIVAPRRTESGFYYLQLGRGDPSAKAKNLLVLSVTALTQTPDIHVDQPLESGQRSSLRCSLPGACAHGGPPIVSWHGEVLGPLGLVNSSEISLAPHPQDHGTQLTCRVTVLGVNVSTERTITLNVSYAPENLTIFREDCAERRELDNGSSVVVEEGTSLGLVCGARGNPPPRLSWVWEHRLLPPSQSSGAGVLALHPVEQHHEGKYTCQAEHPRGSLHASLHLSVRTPLQLLGPSCSWEAQVLHCSCSSHAHPAPALRWWLDQGLLQENRSNASFQVISSSQGPWANSSLSLWEGFGAGLTVRCETQNVHGAQSASVLLLPGQPGLRGGTFLGAIGGAGVVGLLALCLCFLVIIVKACKKGAPKKVAGRDETAPLGPTSRGFQLEHLPEGPPELPMASLGPREKPELHYAELSFQGLRPCVPAQAAASTEYAEIKTHK